MGVIFILFLNSSHVETLRLLFGFYQNTGRSQNFMQNKRSRDVYFISFTHIRVLANGLNYAHKKYNQNECFMILKTIL